jgi:hypothetical protein
MTPKLAERSGTDVEKAAWVHPENRPSEPEATPSLEKRLWSVLPLSILAGLIGMTYGAAALSSALSFGTIMEVVSLIPLVAALVTLASGWTAAMFCLCKDEPHSR